MEQGLHLTECGRIGTTDETWRSKMPSFAATCGRGALLVAVAAGVGVAGLRSAGGSCDAVRLLRCGDDGHAEPAAELPGSRGVAAILALPSGRLAGAGV